MVEDLIPAALIYHLVEANVTASHFYGIFPARIYAF
jgi:hypothetical protein